MDYYLVPGATWSLIKKGETVQVIGKAKNNTWYRCMALRESKVELDKAPFSFMIKSIVNKPSQRHSKSKEPSGITPEMIEEEYSQRDLDEAFVADDLVEVNTYVQIRTPYFNGLLGMSIHTDTTIVHYLYMA